MLQCKRLTRQGNFLSYFPELSSFYVKDVLEFVNVEIIGAVSLISIQLVRLALQCLADADPSPSALSPNPSTYPHTGMSCFPTIGCVYQ